MSEPFIDALHDRLKAGDASGRGQCETDGDHAGTLSRWWGEFVEVVGQMVGAWNEREAPRPPINFTKQADAVHVWHRSAEATCTIAGDAVRVSTRLGAGPERDTTLVLKIATDGHVVVATDGGDLHTPSAAAEQVLTPLFVETFAKP